VDCKLNNQDTPPEYKAAKSRYNKLLVEHERELNDLKIKTSDKVTKTTWNIVNSKIKNCKNDKSISLNVNNITVTDQEQVANTLLDTFLTLPHTPPVVNALPKTRPRTNHRMFLYPTHAAEVRSIIMSLSNSRAAGEDEVPTFLLKECADLICEPFADIINMCFKSGTYPDHFKIGKIIPVHKKGSKSDPNNYRPITLLSVFSKVLEKIFVMRLTSYLSKFDLLNESQYAYQKGKSVTLAIFNLLTAIYESLESSNHTITTCFDYSKAFDTIVSLCLSPKLQDLGIVGPPLDFIISSMTDRKLFVQLTSKNPEGVTTYVKSRTETWGIGAPQGSIIAAFIFLLAANDLPHFVQRALDSVDNFLNDKSMLLLYADDVNHVASSRDYDTLMQICSTTINIIRDFSVENKLVLNIPKTMCMYFHPPTNIPTVQPELRINDVIITQPSVLPFLGFRLDPTLNFSAHIDHICKNLLKGIYVLGSLRNVLSFDVLKIVYYAHIVSHIRNNIVFWGSCYEAKRIFILQKRAIRTIYKVNRLTSCNDLFFDMEVLTAPAIYILECAMFVKKNPSLFVRNEDVHSHDTRSRGDLRCIQHSKALLEKSPKYRMVHIYNSLPSSLKEQKSVKIFKRELNELLLNKNMYNVEEFFS
jgi:hypothetical protein